VNGLTESQKYFDIRDDDIPAVVAYFESRELIAANAKPCVEDLVDSIFYVVRENKQRILDDADIVSSVYHEQDKIRRQIDDSIDPSNLPDEDRDVVVDAVHFSNTGQIDVTITGDKKHRLKLQADLGNIFNLIITSIADEL